MHNPLDHAHNRQLEQAILAVLFDGRTRDAVSTLQEICPKREYFFDQRHQMITAAVFLMAAQGTLINGQTIRLALATIPFSDFHDKGRQIQAKHGLEMADSLLLAVGEECLSAIGEAGGFAAGFKENCEALARFYIQRQAIALLTECQEQLQSPIGSTNTGQIADRAVSGLGALMSRQEGTATVSEAMKRAMALHDAAQLHGNVPKASWGLAALDKVIPLRAARFIVLAGQPGHGKTSLALQAAQATASILGSGAVGLISLEMPAEEIGTILLGRDMQVSSRAIDGGHLSAEQARHASDVIAKWGDSDIYLRSQSGRCTIDEVCAWVRQRHLRSAGKLALVVLDYLQLIDSKGKQTEYERFNEATRVLKRLAIDLRICLLVLSQMTREGGKAERDSVGGLKPNPEPRIQDLRGSGTIEGDADGIVFIWPPQETPMGDLPCLLKIAKNRGGPKPPPIQAVFERANGQRFRQADVSQEQPRLRHHGPPRNDKDVYAEASHGR